LSLTKPPGLTLIPPLLKPWQSPLALKIASDMGLALEANDKNEGSTMGNKVGGTAPMINQTNTMTLIWWTKIKAPF